MLTKDRDLVGQRVLSHYRVDAMLARGGSGVVFAGTDMRDASPVAIKLVRSGIGDESRARRFVREQRAAEALRHPNIVRLLESGVALGGVPVLVWERLTGETLQARLERASPLDLTEVLANALPIMGALSFAHRRGVVHRDVKPSNVFLHRAGATTSPKLLDFGIATLHDASRMTQPGAVVGTLPYVAPERLTHGTADAQGDVWSMGVLLYRCLSGRLPHGMASGTPTAEALARKIVTEAPPPLTVVAPGLSKRLAAAVDRALSPRLDRRYPTMDAFIEALEGVKLAGGGAIGAPRLEAAEQGGDQGGDDATAPIPACDPDAPA